MQIITGILSLPRSYRVVLFSWLKGYASEYFARVVKVLQNFLTFTCEDTVTKLDSSPVVLVLERSAVYAKKNSIPLNFILYFSFIINSVFECNMEAKIVPNELFYNNSIGRKFNIFQEWDKLKSNSMKAVFNICAYPFLIQIQTKNEIIAADYNALMSVQVSYTVYIYISLESPLYHYYQTIYFYVFRAWSLSINI
jgi:hypothetical protein